MIRRAVLLVAGAAMLAAQDVRLSRLQAGVEAEESIRAIKRLQQTYNHELDAGLWNDLGDLVTANATFELATGGATLEKVTGKAAVREHWMKDAGRSALGLADGQLYTHLLLQPIVNLDADGQTAKGTWHEVAMLGEFGKSATWAGGIYENEYARENGVWKIRKIHFTEQYRGAYEEPGMKAPAKWDIPYHFTAQHVGLTIPPTALEHATVAKSPAELTARLQRLEDEAAVENLQHTYGYYMDRKMWDDVADLFAQGRIQMRDTLETRYGAPKLKYGELFDHIMLTTVVTVSPDGRTATALSSELAQVGLTNDYARWELGTYVNDFVKDGGVWKIQALHYYPRVVTDFDKGWAKDGKPAAIPASVVKATTAKLAPVKPGAAKKVDELESMLAQAIGFDATENLNSAYGYYLDESAWDDVAEICASNCVFELSDIGIYIGRDRARKSLKLRYPNNGRGANFFTIHQLTQPVIHVSADGKVARARLRLFQGGGSANGSSASWIGGIYEDQAFFENGEWKYGVKDLQHIFSATAKDGWAKIKPRAANTKVKGPTLPAAFVNFPPDQPERSRQYAFPEILEPAFHYKNPVSGRMPGELLP